MIISNQKLMHPWRGLMGLLSRTWLYLILTIWREILCFNVKWQLLLWLFCQIKRLREEGSKLLKEQQEILKAQLRKEMESGQDETKSEEATPKLKVHD